jgi:hypothetical protein
MKTNKKLWKALITLGLLLVLSVILLLTYLHFKPSTAEGSKKITVEMVIPDEKDKDFTIKKCLFTPKVRV